MKIQLKATKIEMTDAIAGYAQEKIDMLDKFLGDIKVINCDVELEKTITAQNKGEIFRAEINLQIPGELLRVERTETDLYKAIDNVKGHMEEVIIQYKEKLRDKNRGR